MRNTLTLSYLNEADFICSARNLIFKNLSLNSNFLDTSEFLGTELENFYQTILESKSSIDDNHIARIILLLHLSKSNLSRDMCSLTFQSIRSVQIIKNIMNPFISELYKLYPKLLKSKTFQQAISHLIKELTGQDLVYKIEETKLSYFVCSLKGLYGFAGFNQIYVNYNEQFFLHMLLLKCKTDAILILKMNFVRLILHEMAHVALRASTKDFNTSTPIAENKSSRSHLIPEVMAEEILFKQRIDWLESAKKGCNLSYCQTFLDNLINNDDVDFDIELANVILNQSIPSWSAVDSEIKSVDLNFE